MSARLVSFRRPGGVCHPFRCWREKGAVMSTVSGVAGGVDTHADVPVAAALDEDGAVLGIESFPTDTVGYRSLADWLSGFGPVVRREPFGIPHLPRVLSRFGVSQ